MLLSVFCIFGGHKPDRGTIRQRVLDSVAICKCCGTPIRRDPATPWQRHKRRSK